jgi:clathrin heavy chain
MESDKFITVCETSQQQVAIVDLSAGNSVSRQKMSAEAAIMNPVSKVIALRGEYIFFCYLLCLTSFSLVFPIFLLSWSNPSNL